MAQQFKLGTHKTKVMRAGDRITVTYHGTTIVDAKGDNVHLDTGGFFTATTKTRMNQASNQFGLGYRVYQRKDVWYVDDHVTAQTHEFDGVTLYLGRSAT